MQHCNSLLYDRKGYWC